MIKSLFLIGSLCLGSSAMADGLRFTLNCKTDKGISKVPAQVSQYKVIKISSLNPKPTPGKKWVYKYVLAVYFKSQPTKAYEYAFVPAGSGDEDYNEYNVRSSNTSRINVQAAYIQNSFQWANLVDNNGYAFAECRPAGRD